MLNKNSTCFQAWGCIIVSCLGVFLFFPTDGLATFRTFLKSEFSDENIEFWLTCEEYKKIKSSFRMSSKAKKIYEHFIKAEAPKEVRLLQYSMYYRTWLHARDSNSCSDISTESNPAFEVFVTSLMFQCISSTSSG